MEWLDFGSLTFILGAITFSLQTPFFSRDMGTSYTKSRLVRRHMTTQCSSHKLYSLLQIHGRSKRECSHWTNLQFRVASCLAGTLSVQKRTCSLFLIDLNFFVLDPTIHSSKVVIISLRRLEVSSQANGKLGQAPEVLRWNADQVSPLPILLPLCCPPLQPPGNQH